MIKNIRNCIDLNVLLIFVFLAPTITCLCQENENLIITPDKKIVSEGLKYFLNIIPEGKENLYGFINRDEFSEIIIGSPLYLYTLPEDSIIEKKGNDKIIFKFSDEWFLPLFVDNRICSFLFLKKEKNEQKVIGIGANYLSMDINNEVDLISRNEDGNGILLIPRIGGKFLIKGKKELNFYPLGITKCKFKNKDNKYLKKKDLFEQTYFELIN